MRIDRKTWPVVVGGLAASAGALGAIAMPLSAAVAGASVLAVVGLLRPTLLVLFSLLGILFVESLQAVTGLEAMTYLDEVLVASCLVFLPVSRLLSGKPLRWTPETGWILGFLAVGVTSGIVLHVEWAVLGEGALLAVKGALMAWAIAQIDWTERDFVITVRTVGVLLAFILVCAAINLAEPATWSAIVVPGGEVQYRYGLPSLVGPFAHPSAFGQITALGAIAVVAYRATIAKSVASAVLLVGSLLAVVFSFRRRLVVGVLASILFVRLKTRRATTALLTLVVFPPALIMLWPLLSTSAQALYTDYFASEPAARTVITRDSFGVAADHFPFGAGFGRFGSFIAGEVYSPEYVARDYPAIYGLGNTTDRGNEWLTDTQWPAIIGESGFIGTAFYIVALAVMYRRFRAAWRSEAAPWLRCLGLTGLGWTVMMLIDSVASPVFNAAPTFPLLFALGAMLRSGQEVSRAAVASSEVVDSLDHPAVALQSRIRGQRRHADQDDVVARARA